MSIRKCERALVLGFRYEALNRPGVQRPDVDVHAGAGLQRVHDNEADDQGERRQHLEIDQRLEADAADLLHVLHAGNAVHDRAKDDRRNDHLDQFDEGVAQRLHLLAELRVEVSERDADDDGRDHLQVEALVERLVRRAPSHGGCLSHVIPPASSHRPGAWVAPADA